MGRNGHGGSDGQDGKTSPERISEGATNIMFFGFAIAFTCLFALPVLAVAVKISLWILNI